MALTVTSAGTVIGKENLGNSITSFTVNVAAIKANSMLFQNRLDSSNGLGSGLISSYTISAGTSFTQNFNSTSTTTESIGWELII